MRPIPIFILVLSLTALTGCPPPAQTKRPQMHPQTRPPRPMQTHATMPPPQQQQPRPPQQQQRPTMQPAPRASVHTQVIGHSMRGRPIYMHIFGTAPNPALVFGGIHGNERNSSEMADLLIEHLQRNPQLTQRQSVAVIPHANPDGLVANTRHNVRNVDLNRNFPASNWKSTKDHHGETPLSESESRALYNAVRGLRPRLTISLHSINGQNQCNNFDGPAENVARIMARFNGYPVKGSIGYPTPGSFGSWCGKDLNIPTITLEIPKTMPGATGWKQNRDAILAAIGF